MCVPMCSRQPPGRLAWGEGTRGDQGARNASGRVQFLGNSDSIRDFPKQSFRGDNSARLRGMGSPNHSEGAPAALGGGSKRCRRASPRDHARQTCRPGDAVVEPAPRGGNDAWPFAPRRPGTRDDSGGVVTARDAC